MAYYCMYCGKVLTTGDRIDCCFKCHCQNTYGNLTGTYSAPLTDANIIKDLQQQNNTLTATIAQKDAEIERLRGVLTNISIFDEGNISEYVIMSMKNLARNALAVNYD